MSRRVTILPTEVLHELCAKVNGEYSDQSAGHLHFLRLPHPRTGLLTLYLPHESSDQAQSSIMELQSISPTNPRTWFMPEGEVIGDGQLLVMTPIDPSLLLIPILRLAHPTEEATGQFRPVEDILEDTFSKLSQTYGDGTLDTECSIEDLMYLSSMTCIRKGLRRICEIKEVTSSIIVYRYSPAKTMDYLKAKVARLSSPAISEMSNTLLRNLARDGLMDDGKELLLELARTRVACDLVLQYIPEDLYSRLLAAYDFSALDVHLRTVQDEAVAIVEPEGKENKSGSKSAETTEKKRKTQAKASHGVEKLKKANVKGMAKISSFFQKPAK